MYYSIEFKPKSIKDLKKIQKNEQLIILQKIEGLSGNLNGDVKKLTKFSPEYRLRVGSYRVLFEIENNCVIIYRILHRRESYKKK